MGSLHVKMEFLPKLVSAIPVKILDGLKKTLTSSILHLDGKAKDLEWQNNLEEEETG